MWYSGRVGKKSSDKVTFRVTILQRFALIHVRGAIYLILFAYGTTGQRKLCSDSRGRELPTLTDVTK
jgi:hypothetical protein